MSKIALPFEIPREWSATTAQAIEDNFRKLFGSSARLGPPPSASGAALVNGLDLIVPAAGDMIVCVVGGIFIALPIVATNQRVLTNNAGTPTWALLDLANGVTGLLPYTNFVNATATQRLLGRNTAGGGVWEEVTLTQLLDWVGSPARGDILYRNATGWTRLGAGTSGFFLQTLGAGADPAWAAVVVVPGTITFTNTQRVLGRNTAGGGAGEEVTLTQILDWVGSAAQGDILYRNATGWVRLAAGTAGQVLQTGGASANPAWGATVGPANPLNFQSHIEYIVNLAGAFIGTHGNAGSITATTQAYPAAGSILAGGQYYRSAGAASTNSTTSFTSGTSGTNKELSFAWDFDISFVIMTDASAVTTVRYLVGVGVNNEDTDNITAASYIGIRFSTGAGDTTWVGVTSDTTQAVTAALSAAVLANTRYVLRIRKVGGTVFFSVNGGAEVSTSSHVPTNNVYASIVLRCTTLANSVRAIQFSRLWCDFGS